MTNKFQKMAARLAYHAGNKRSEPSVPHSTTIVPKSMLEHAAQLMRELEIGGVWRHIDEAPKDGTQIIAVAVGDDGRPLTAIVHWADPVTMYSSNLAKYRVEERCEWIGSNSGTRYGVLFTHWMPVPRPPKSYQTAWANPTGDATLAEAVFKHVLKDTESIRNAGRESAFRKSGKK